MTARSYCDETLLKPMDRTAVKCLDDILFQLSMTDFHKLFMVKINKMIKKKSGEGGSF